ncbi:MAG TPA: SRPBCC family protein [Nitrososphaeraceae archaeon]|jgi:carbon monoxide dehydrogenase subunit G|nr:SRPBCC family protein [Nitrososphaeraceae archaeon]
MDIIQVGAELSAPLDKVWNIISDIDNEPKYWYGTKYIKNSVKNGNVIEREVIIAFKNSTCKETVVLEDKKSVKIKITDGPINGTKTIIINPIGDTKTKIDVIWNIKVTGLLGMFHGMVKKHIAKGTKDAIDRISKAL